jgi:hypothetical protein
VNARVRRPISWTCARCWGRMVARNDECAKELSKRTPTNLYHQRARLALAHERLDKAVFAASGWPWPMSDEEILKQLLALNLKRA